MAKPTFPVKAVPARQSGFSLVTALFLLLVFAALGAFMVSFSSAQQIASVLDLDRARAYQAARAGAQYGVYQLVTAGVPCAAKMADLSFSDGILDTFTATVQCQAYGPYTDEGTTLTVYQLTSTACNRPAAGSCPGSPAAMNYAERQLRVTLSK